MLMLTDDLTESRLIILLRIRFLPLLPYSYRECRNGSSDWVNSIVLPPLWSRSLRHDTG